MDRRRTIKAYARSRSRLGEGCKKIVARQIQQVGAGAFFQCAAQIDAVDQRAQRIGDGLGPRADQRPQIRRQVRPQTVVIDPQQPDRWIITAIADVIASIAH